MRQKYGKGVLWLLRGLRMIVGIATVLAWTLFGAGQARANGRFPAASQLVIFPSAPEAMVLRTTYGILFSRDAGKNWDWVCERAVGYGGQEDPALGVVGGKTVLAATLQGLSVSRDLGCTWGFAAGELKPHAFIDVTTRNFSTALALTSTYVGADDAGTSFYVSQLFATTDEGASWNRHGTALPPYTLPETVDVAPSDTARIYISATRPRLATAEGLFYASADDGQSFTESHLELSPDERRPYIAAIDPANANRVYVRTTGPKIGRLLVTDDAGRTFRSVFTGPPLLGFALSADGSKVWVGNDEGLYVAGSHDLVFTKRSNLVVQCLARAGATLYACSTESSGFILGASTDEGASFTALLHLSTLRGPLACPAATPTANCEAEWPALREQLGIETPVPPEESPGSCSVTMAKTGSLVALFAVLVSVLALGFRRRKE